MAIATGATLRRSRLSFASRQALWGYLLVLPAIALVLGLVAYPFFFAIYISFTDRIVGNPGSWIGFDNFRYLSHNPSFTRSIRNTITLVLVTDALKLAIGLGLALLVNQQIKGRGIFRAFIMIPWAMPGFVAFLTWLECYGPVLGRTTTPRVQDLVTEPRAQKWFALYFVAVWVAALALLFTMPSLFRLGAGAMLFATIGIGVQLMRTRRLANVAPALRLPKGVQPPHLLHSSVQPS